MRVLFLRVAVVAAACMTLTVPAGAAPRTEPGDAPYVSPAAPGSPEEVAEAFGRAVNDGDRATAMRLVHAAGPGPSSYDVMRRQQPLIREPAECVTLSTATRACTFYWTEPMDWLFARKVAGAWKVAGVLSPGTYALDRFPSRCREDHQGTQSARTVRATWVKGGARSNSTSLARLGRGRVVTACRGGDNGWTAVAVGETIGFLPTRDLRATVPPTPAPG